MQNVWGAARQYDAYLLLKLMPFRIQCSANLHVVEKCHAPECRNEARKQVTQLQADLREAKSAAAAHTSLHSALSHGKSQLQAQLKELSSSRQASLHYFASLQQFAVGSQNTVTALQACFSISIYCKSIACKWLFPLFLTVMNSWAGV